MREIDLKGLKIRGIMVNYLYVCERKLWLFDRGIGMESSYDRVLIGKLTGEYFYRDEELKEVLIDNLISIDVIDEEEIKEVKASNRLAHAHRIQILYYLYYLKELGVVKKGVINYPKQRRKEVVELTPDAEREVESALLRVKEIISLEKPPPVIKKPYCNKCAYFDFCFVGEE